MLNKFAHFIELPPSQVDLQQRMLLKVEKMVADEWSRFGRFLGLEDRAIEKIDREKVTVEEKCMRVIQAWKRKNGTNITMLKSALREMDRHDILAKIEEFESKVLLYSSPVSLV